MIKVPWIFPKVRPGIIRETKSEQRAHIVCVSGTSPRPPDRPPACVAACVWHVVWTPVQELFRAGEQGPPVCSVFNIPQPWHQPGYRKDTPPNAKWLCAGRGPLTPSSLAGGSWQGGGPPTPESRGSPQQCNQRDALNATLFCCIN